MPTTPIDQGLQPEIGINTLENQLFDHLEQLSPQALKGAARAWAQAVASAVGVDDGVCVVEGDGDGVWVGVGDGVCVGVGVGVCVAVAVAVGVCVGVGVGVGVDTVTMPVIPIEQWGLQKYGNDPTLLKVCEKVAPWLRIPESQTPLGVHGLPEVVL